MQVEVNWRNFQSYTPSYDRLSGNGDKSYQYDLNVGFERLNYSMNNVSMQAITLNSTRFLELFCDAKR